ncbi:hypothetical protein [Clostridium sp. 'White wine YQ']|uniref:hypothetical protein n=1 Tax=Clostridium sp. 'White wine YQ' TaxID=3027474 RepID=UPI00236731DE|nr:hypothetical protein [Clostridium sp. 'White wine YQ']MDD7794477.1 hypothetical protein [Clostridium sp. 'White wine YQ']
MKKGLNIIALLVVTSLFLVACNNKKDDASKTDNKQVEASQNNDSENNTSDKTTDESQPADNQSEEIKIKDANINQENKKDETNATVKKEASLDDKVKAVTKGVMDKWFNGKSYEVSTKKENNKVIAIINLKETKSVQDESSWYQQFQGDQQALINAKRIVNNILQKGYSGEWVQGVKVLYNGEECQFEHAPQLTETNYNTI